MIIVEGPDGAGKTTLVNRLRKDFPELTEGERGTSNRKLLYTVTVPDTYTALRYAVNPYDHPRIWDRLFYSEFVYAPMGGREPRFNLAQTKFIREMIEAMRVPVIVCLPPLPDVKKNVLVEDQMDGVVDKISLIYTSYTRMLRDGWFGPAVIVYDYTRQNVNEQYNQMSEKIDDYLVTRRNQQW